MFNTPNSNEEEYKDGIRKFFQQREGLMKFLARDVLDYLVYNQGPFNFLVTRGLQLYTDKGELNITIGMNEHRGTSIVVKESDNKALMYEIDSVTVEFIKDIDNEESSAMRLAFMNQNANIAVGIAQEYA